jgi:hypothetical protein
MFCFDRAVRERSLNTPERRPVAFCVGGDVPTQMLYTSLSENVKQAVKSSFSLWTCVHTKE